MSDSDWIILAGILKKFLYREDPQLSLCELLVVLRSQSGNRGEGTSNRVRCFTGVV